MTVGEPFAPAIAIPQTARLLWQCGCVRFLLKLLLPVAVVIVLAVGLLPPLFARGSLDTATLNAAKAAASALSTNSGPTAQSTAEAAVERSVAGMHDVRIVSVQVNPDGQTDTVQVTLTETVHSFMDGLPGVRRWFHLTSTQESALGA